jgi:hypothetical protein
MSKNHTPGPWRLDDTSEFDADLLTDGYHAITAGPGCFGSKEKPVGFCAALFCSDADGRLIAAAPDLAEALEDMLEAWNGFSDAELARRNRAGVLDDCMLSGISKARAALAKARGETKGTP